MCFAPASDGLVKIRQGTEGRDDFAELRELIVDRPTVQLGFDLFVKDGGGGREVEPLKLRHLFDVLE